MKRFDKAAFGHLYINQLVGASERRDQEERLDFTTKDAKHAPSKAEGSTKFKNNNFQLLRVLRELRGAIGFSRRENIIEGSANAKQVS